MEEHKTTRLLLPRHPWRISLFSLCWVAFPVLVSSWILNQNHERISRSSFLTTPAGALSFGQGHVHGLLRASISGLNTPLIEAIAASGIDDQELDDVVQAIGGVCHEFGYDCSADPRYRTRVPCSPHSVSGATGRVILLKTSLAEDFIFDLQCAISEQMDQLLYSDNPAIKQPVLVSIRKDIGLITGDNFNEALATIVEEEVNEYDMLLPVAEGRVSDEPTGMCAPTLHVELDGGHVENPSNSTTIWDTSTLLVFDDLVSDDLRARLLDIVLGKINVNPDLPLWDDAKNGPDPRRWVRGGLLDMPESHNSDSMKDDEGEGTCWGLKDEGIVDLCFHQHAAVQEFESILTLLFPNFVVCRLPEAVFGSSVSPLTANAPTCGDLFNYHIDGDPNLTPPSPWTDVFGRYPNRMKGKPRFMSCLIYLNEEWHGEQWGAPTRFLDIPTNSHYDVLPRPGRCVMMDQDISHTVVPPTTSAGKRPRYSLVWKLVLHPKRRDQDMTIRAGSTSRVSHWPEITSFGSATRDENLG